MNRSVLLLLFLVSTSAAAQGEPAANQVALKKGDRILFYGDSLTAQALTPKAWVTLLGEHFKKSALETMIERLRKAEVCVVLCSCTSLGEKKDGSNRIDKKLDEFAEVARQVARDKKVPLNDLRKAFPLEQEQPGQQGQGHILTYDGNHFNDTGNQFVAEQMLKMFAAPKKAD